MRQIIVADKLFIDEKQALIELAFCHYPVNVSVDGKQMCFEDFTSAKKFIDTECI